MLSNTTWTNWIIYDLIYDFSNRVLLVMSVRNLCIQKYVKIKAKASLCRKLLIRFWPSIYLKLETVHKFIKSKKKKKWINIMHICDYWVGVNISMINFYLSFMYIKIPIQYILEQYFYIALYRQKIPTVSLGRE